MKALFVAGMLVLGMSTMAMTCAPKPDAEPCTGTWHQDPAPAEFTSYVGDDGKNHKCTKKVEGISGGHCKSTKGYNGCSDNPTTCCHK